MTSSVTCPARWLRIWPLLSCDSVGERTLAHPAAPAMVQRGADVWLYVHESGARSCTNVELLPHLALLHAKPPHATQCYTTSLHPIPFPLTPSPHPTPSLPACPYPPPLTSTLPSSGAPLLNVTCPSYDTNTPSHPAKPLPHLSQVHLVLPLHSYTQCLVLLSTRTCLVSCTTRGSGWKPLAGLCATPYRSKRLSNGLCERCDRLE